MSGGPATLSSQVALFHSYVSYFLCPCNVHNCILVEAKAVEFFFVEPLPVLLTGRKDLIGSLYEFLITWGRNM